MPTYNRAWILEYTLNQLRDQIKRNAKDVELVVCNNASPDNTQDVINSILKDDPFFTFVNYEEYVEIGVSLSRSIENGTGRYFMLVGDDDVLDPYMVDVLVAKLKMYPDVSCIHFNRLQGNPDEGFGLKNLNVFYKDYPNTEILYEDSKEFIKDRYRGMCFLSVYVITKEAWDKGKNIWTKEHYGFEYLAPILYGISGGKCLYISYPLCIQRFLTNPQYMDKWPLYIYVGIPRMLKDLEKLGCIDDWRDCYCKYHSINNNMDFVHHILFIACSNKEFYAQYYDEIYDYLTNKYRRKIIKFLKYPDWKIHLFQKLYLRSHGFIRRLFIPKYKVDIK